MYIVDEYRLVKVTYVVDEASRRDAESAMNEIRDTIMLASVEPELVEVKKRDIRDMTDKDEQDYVIKRAIRFMASDSNEPEVPKKRGRPLKKKD